MAFNESETERHFSIEKEESLLAIQELREFESASKTILRKWHPEQRLGGGSFAHVFRVKNRKSGEIAALKFIPIPKKRSECVADPNYYRYEFEDQKKEASLLAQFKGSPHIIQVIDEPEFLTIRIQTDSGKVLTRHAILILMPLLKSMDEWKPHIKDSFSERWKLGEQITTALVAFNEKKIRHRDIKPGNILMDERGDFFLTDLGEAKRGEQTTTHTPRGTEGYMAPEVYHAMITDEVFDHRADIYSLGIVLYELFNWGQKPFIGPNGTLRKESVHAYRNIFGGEKTTSLHPGSCAFALRYSGKIDLTPPGEVIDDAELVQIILKACSYDPAKRYSNAQSLLQDLHAYRSNHPEKFILTGSPLKPYVPPQTPIHIKRDIRPLFAGVALIIVVAIGVVYWIILPPLPPSDENNDIQSISVANSSLPPSALDFSSIPTLTSTPYIELAPSATPTNTPPSVSSTTTIKESERIQSGDYTIQVHGNESCSIVDYHGDEAALVIPDEIDGKTIVSIADNAFRTCYKLKKVTIPEGVTSIGAWAFGYCEELASIIIPNTVTSIEEYAFAGCKKLTDVVIPTGVTRIEAKTFMGCNSLVNVTIPAGVISIGVASFQDCHALKSLVIPASVTRIEEHAFTYCSSLTHITIPSSVKDISAQAFSGCNSLQRIYGVPDSPAHALAQMIGIEFFDATAPNTVSTQALTPTPSPFLASPSLSPSYTPTPISEYVQSGDYYIEAFMDGTCALRGYRGNEEYLSVPEVIDGKRVVEIGSYAFAQHNFEKTVDFIDFNDDGTIETDFAAYYDQWYRLCNRDTKSIFIPEGVVSIDANAFTGCLNLSHVSILGKSVAVDENAFNQCEKIETISKYSGDYFITIQTDGTCVLGGYIGSDSHVIIPQIIDGNRVIGIESYAFNKRDNENLTSVVIPDGVISIDFDAFYGCDKLVTATIPESVVGIIDKNSYRYPYKPFSSCSSLQTIRGVHGSEAEIYAYDHGYHFEALATTTQSTPIPKEYLDFKIRVLEDGSCEITDYAGSHEHLIIPQEIYGHRVVGITDMAFEYSDNLKSIVIPDSISSIDQSVFHFCSNLVDVQLPNNIKTIAAYTFQACESLENIVIPDSVISIGEDAFMWSGLTNITIPSSVVSIDDDAFAGSNLTRIYGISGSTAETIAHELGVEFVDLSDPAPTHTPSPSFTPIPTPTAIPAPSTPEILSGQSPTGFGGTISVEVERQNNRISDIRILQAYESEDRGMPAINEMIDRMIDSNSTNVDYVSGATISSKAIVKAVKDALEK